MQLEVKATGYALVAEIHLAFVEGEPVAFVQLPGIPDKCISPHALSVAARLAEAAKAGWIEALSDVPQHSAPCAKDGPAETSGCGDAASATAPQERPGIPNLDPLTIMAMARERVVAHGGSFLETVRDLVEAHRELHALLSLKDAGRP